MKGWSGYQNSPLKQEVKPREGEVYIGPKPTIRNEEGKVIKNPNYVEGDEYIMSNEPMYEGHGSSTHLMAWDEKDGKFYAFPTLFQDDEGVWSEGGRESLDKAKRKGELYEFDTEEEAKAFAAGNWKDKHFNK